MTQAEADVLTAETECAIALDRVAVLVKRVTELEGFVEQIRDGFDCDRDAHRYNTLCRCCTAGAILNGDPEPYSVHLGPL